MISTRPTFTAVVDVRSAYKRNGSSRIMYKSAPKKVTSMSEALCWYYDHVHNRGKGNKRLIEMRQG